MQYPTLSVQDGFIEASGLMSTNTMPAAWEIEGAISAEEILAAVNLVAARHESLRTGIVRDPAGSYHQRVAFPDEVSHEIDVVDLTRDDDAEAAMSWLMGEHLADPFDLTTPPLWRGFLAAIAEGRWVLGLAFAHVMVDGTSVSVFARDLAHALGGVPQPDPVQLGALALAERSIEPTAQQVSWWEGEYGQRRGLAGTWGGHRAHYRVHPVPGFPPGEVERLRFLATANEASISTMFGALVAVAAAGVLDTQPMLGVTTAQRNPDNESTFGPVHDHLPVLADTAVDSSFAALVRNLHARRVMARAHRLPSAVLAGIAGSTPYDVAVNFSPFQAPAPQPVADGRGTVTARPIPTIGNVGVYRATSVAPPAAAILRPQPDGSVTGDITAVSALFTAPQVRGLALALSAVARDVLDDPEQTLGSLMSR